MERDGNVAGGCVGPATVDLTGDRDDDSWDQSYVILREAGSAAEAVQNLMILVWLLQLAVDTEEAGAWLRLLLGEHLERANSARVVQKSFMKWISVLQCWLETWKVRKKLDECETVQASCELVSHYFSGKAPATLVKRANSMIYIVEEGYKLGYLFPYTQREFYNLLKTLKAAGAKSSRLKSVLEAVTLSRFTCNIDELHELTCSRRCYGAIAAGPLEKASKLLHEVLEGSSDLWDIVFYATKRGLSRPDRLSLGTIRVLTR